MVDPQRCNGKRASYLAQASDDLSLLEIESITFYPPLSSVECTSAGVTLLRLMPGEKSLQRLSSIPFSETYPPFEKEHEIDFDRIKKVRVVIGFLPDDEGIRDFLTRKPFGPFVDGLEKMGKGLNQNKNLIEIQRIARSEAVPFSP